MATKRRKIPEEGVRVRFQGTEAYVHDQGIMFRVHLVDNEEDIHVPRSKTKTPANLRRVVQLAADKKE